MDTIATAIAEALASHDVVARATTRAGLQRELAALERERAEVAQRISAWDRIAFFHTTPDEARASSLGERIEALRLQARAVDAEQSTAFDAIGRHIVPFAVARRVSQCVDLARDGLEVAGLIFGKVAEKRDLTEHLDALAELVRDTWLPSFDADALLAALDAGPARGGAAGEDGVDAIVAQRLAEPGDPDVAAPEIERLVAAVEARYAALAGAGPARELARDDVLGWAPADEEALLPVIARRLLDNGHPRARVAALVTEGVRAALEAQHRAKAEAVPWLDKLDVFRMSPAERARNEAAKAWAEALEAERAAHEEERALFADGLRAYPPLDVYHAVLESAAVLGLVTAGREATLAPSGRTEQRRIVTRAPLLLGALHNLAHAFDRAFPEVPRPDTLVATALGAPGAAPEPAAGHAGGGGFAGLAAPALAQPRAVALLCDALDGSSAPHVLQRALHHAGVRGHILEQLIAAKKRITLVDRLVFWSRSRAEREADELARRNDAKADWLRRLSDELLQTATALGQRIGPFAVRDRGVQASMAVAAIHTQGGSSGVPRNCTVLGRELARAALDEIDQALLRHFGISGSRRALMDEVAAWLTARPGESAPWMDQPTIVAPLSHNDLVALIAYRLQETQWLSLYREAGTALDERLALEDQLQDVDRRISFWDRLNIFRTTPDEARRKELKTELGGLSADQQRLASGAEDLFSAALEVHPPAVLAFGVADVVDAVDNIRAVCRSRTVSTGSGKSRRTKTVYYCALIGHQAAIDAMRRWGAYFATVFGALPGYEEALELWQLRAAFASGGSLAGRDGVGEVDDPIGSDALPEPGPDDDDLIDDEPSGGGPDGGSGGGAAPPPGT